MDIDSEVVVALPPEPPEKIDLRPVFVIPPDFPARIAMVEKAWAKLSIEQRTFLAAFRECRYNARETARKLGSESKRISHRGWMHQKDYATVVQIWRGEAAADALDRDRLLARQDDIVETLLTPKPILHQGVATGHYEIEAGAASRANEVLLDRVMPKPRADVEVNVGVVFTPPSVEVINSAGNADSVDAEFVEVSPVLPDEDWPNA